MKLPCLLVSLLLLLAAISPAQTGGGGSGTGGGASGGGRGGGGSTSGNIPTTTLPRNFPTPKAHLPTLFLSGKVVVDDGTELANAAAIQTSCRGASHTVGYTDSKGNFSFQLDPNTNASTSGLGDVTDTSATIREQNDQDGHTPSWSDCQVRALLAGYTSQVVDLASRVTGETRADLGNVVLHHIGQVQGYTISATSAAAPPKARKDFEKGLSLEKKSDWHGAEQKFQAAVDFYPKYAEAWVELGRAQMNQGREADAKQSLQKALQADSQFVPAYEVMAEIAASRKQWKDLAEVTDQLVRLNPVSLPRYWFLNSAANYNLHNYDYAQKSAMRGLSIDPEHHFPQLEFLLGLTLALKHDYHGSAVHLRNYLQLAPNAQDAEQARSQLSQVEAMEVKAAPDPDAAAVDAEPK
jgi:tetratricopeptide (TPR) repeat protein